MRNDSTSRNLFTLSKVRLIKKSDLFLLFVGIILVSIIASAASAFSSGLLEKSFYLGNEDDVMIITQPGASTPVTSRVPLYLTEQLMQIKSVKAISPETLGLCVVSNARNEEVITVRGVTSKYRSVSTVNMMSGIWLFEEEQNSSKSMNSIVIGATLKNELGLDVNDKLVLSSTITEAIIEMTVIGTLAPTNTPIDEELFVSLQNGQIVNGLNREETTIIRVNYEPKIITESTIRKSLNARYNLQITVNSIFPENLVDIEKFKVKLFTDSKELISSFSFSSLNDTISTSLPFGRYLIGLIVPDDFPYFDVQFKEVLLNYDKDVNFDIAELIDNVKI